MAKDHSVSYRAHPLALKQFKSEYCRSYRPVINSLALHEILTPEPSPTGKACNYSIAVGATHPKLTLAPVTETCALASLSSHLPSLLLM
jgi:hypothetical protein